MSESNKKWVKEEKRTVSTSTSELILRDGILEIRYKEGSEVDLSAKKEIFRGIRELLKGPVPKLIEADQEVVLTPCAREFASRVERLRPFKKVAVVTTSLHYRLVADFYKNFHEPAVPFRVFSSREEARAWLKGEGADQEGPAS